MTINMIHLEREANTLSHTHTDTHVRMERQQLRGLTVVFFVAVNIIINL